MEKKIYGYVTVADPRIKLFGGLKVDSPLAKLRRAK